MATQNPNLAQKTGDAVVHVPVDVLQTGVSELQNAVDGIKDLITGTASLGDQAFDSTSNAALKRLQGAIAPFEKLLHLTPQPKK